MTIALRLRLRVQRATARLLWYQHRTGARSLSKHQLKKIIRTLATRHSRDSQLLRAITMAQESYAWNCPCGRLCGKRHVHCSGCKGHWSLGVPHSNRPKSPRHYNQLEAWNWRQDADWQGGGRAAKKQNQQRPKSRSTSLRSKWKGKGKRPEVAPSPFLQTTSTPWPPPETNFAFPTPPPQAAPSTAAGPAPAIVENTELLLAVTKHYPDINKAPVNIQASVERAEKANAKLLGKYLHKASSAVDKAAKELRNLRDAKATHREKWLQRLRDAAVRWEEQLKQHTDQQSKATMPPWPRKSSWNSKQQDTPCLPSTRKQQMCMEILQKLRKLCQIRRTRTTMQKHKSLRSRCTRALTLRHGDYVGIAVPPFEQPLLPAYFAVKACQAGLSRSQTIRHVQVYGADEDRLHPAVEAAQEAAPHDLDHPEDCADEATLFQIAPRCAVKLDGPPSDPITFERSAPGAYQRGGPYDDEPLPAWTSAFHAAFIDSAAVECEEEGPIGYVESCNMVLARHKTLFHRGVQNLKADQFQQHWKDQLIDLWRDHIRWTLPLLFHWVQPTPRALITRDRIGHLILQQEPLLFLVPTVVTIDFQGTHRAAFGFAAALLENLVRPHQVRDLLRLS